jgi:hypothetical protein
MSTELIIGLVLVAGIALLVAYRKGVFREKEGKGWSEGPIGKDGNYSKNVKVSGTGFAFPVGVDGIHYFTKARGPIIGNSITLECYIEADPTVRFVGVEDGREGTMSVYIAGPDWRAPHGRWYCPLEYRTPVTAGKHTITVPLDGLWMGATDDNSSTAPAQFRDCLAKPGRIGWVFGGNAGRGHGVFATGPAEFIAGRVDA